MAFKKRAGSASKKSLKALLGSRSHAALKSSTLAFSSGLRATPSNIAGVNPGSFLLISLRRG
jgi:hypothetical protein